MTWSPRLVITSSAVLIGAIFVPRFTFFQSVIVAPAFIALATCVGAVLLIRSLLRADPAGDGPGRRPTLRPLVFTTPSAWSAVLTRQSWEEQTTSSRGPALFSTAPAAVKDALDRLLDLIQRHFILPWYSRISPSPAFPKGTDTLIRHVIANFVTQGEHVDWSSLLVSRIVPIVRDHLQHYRSVENLASDSRTALPLPLPIKAHPALSTQDHSSASGTPPLVESHLRAQLELLLGRLLPEADRSEVVKLLVREIVLGAVLLPVYEMLCDPDFWNRQIDDRGGRYLHEQRQVSRFLSALSTIPDSPSATVTPVKPRTSYPPATAFISAESSTQHFDAFIRSISRLKTLGEARRFRADLDRETRVAQAALNDEELKESGGKEGERVLKRAKKYVQRLGRASAQVDARIGVLSGLSANPEVLRSPLSVSRSSAAQPDIALRTVLLDPSSLAYWLEFMERRNRSKLVQFWLTVEGFKDPLELAEPSSFGTFDPQSGSEADGTILDDTTFLYEMYFAAGSDMGVSTRDIGVIRDFVKSPVAPVSAQAVRVVKGSIFSAQQAVYEQMEEEDWSEFKRGELYRKAMQDLSRQRPLDQNAFSPRSVTSPLVAAVQPGKPVRHVSSPLLETKVRRPPPKIGPTLVNGNFTPTTSVAPFASISTAPPTFSRSLTQVRAIPSSSQAHTPTGTQPSTPPKRFNHLDVLFTGGANSPTATESERRIFDDDDEVDVDDDDFVQVQRMEAIQAALSEIIASDDMISSRVEAHASPTPGSVAPSMTTSLVLSPLSERDERSSKLASRSAEDLRSAGLAGPAVSVPPTGSSKEGGPTLQRRQSMSKLSSSVDRDRLFDDITEAEADDQPTESVDPEYVQLAAPGNLHLGPEISRLELRVQELIKQENLLEGLIRRAELTGNEAELKLLQKSISTVRRDLRGSVFQKAQYEQQEEENRLVPGRTVVSVPSAHVTVDATEGKQVARYAVRVSQMGEDGRSVEGSWVVYRRYNQFFELDKAVKDWAAGSADRELMREIRGLVELPGKKLGPSTSAGLMESRRQGLERYLKSLVTSASLCNSDILRNFLSRSSASFPSAPLPGQTASVASLAPHNIVRSLYKSVATTLDETPLGPSMLDMIHSTLNRQFSDVAGGLGEVVELGGELFGYGSSFIPPLLKGGMGGLTGSPEIGGTAGGALKAGGEAESGSTVFTAPICDLFIEMFDLDESSWLRRQAIVVILQQFLGSTIESRKVRDTLRGVAHPDSLEKLLVSFQDMLFPDGERRPPSEERNETEKLATRHRASKKLALLIPDIAANMIGRSNARRAARRVFGVLQDKRLNQHLILKILDEVISALFAKPAPDTTTGSDSDAQSGFPAYSDLTDAARYSLVWIGISLVIILALWCGTVAYISVNKGEGGETHFKPPPARQPAYRPTLAAGYLGSCLIGCALLGAGFDALASKWAALALVGYLFIALVICCSFKRHEEAIALYEKIAAQHKEATGGDDIVADRLRLKRMEDELDQVYEDKMVSLELIISIALFISIGCILPGWLIADSVGLRFVIMFIGLFSAVYAVQDIYDDGVKHRHMSGSDAHNYASLLVTFNPTVEPSQVGWDEEVGEYQWKLESKTKTLAYTSLALQVLAIIITILAALYLVRSTTAEQALRSRQFLPSPWHLHSADLLEKAKQGGQGLQEGLDWGKEKVGSLVGGDDGT
ncbi:PXA domain-containing protein [Dioszegia hungarica]|uniref:PXA domain-containing protein n=1 Tax=Dioszegia hungarica TaxID=4972 RepID=A0AA38H9T2_9TREE|nr:PXA domain-containing protein [Dioszegia hungarica]KAI9635186.1 PXA domain-containing protein [Dioszegia hungarica]